MIITKKNPKISVIIPVYRVEKELDRCVKSLSSQTYRDFEVILVDDGSPDRCPELCDIYAQKYTWIRVLHKENGGLSDARNAGVKIANGEYITFVDSDDWVSPRYLEALINPILNKVADISVVDIQLVEHEMFVNQPIDEPVTFTVSSANAVFSKVLYQKYRDVSACGILLPKQLAQMYPFPKGKLFEDLYTTYHYYLNVKNIAVILEGLYYYYQRPGSIMGCRNDQSILDLEEASSLIVEVCQDDVDLLKAAKNKRFSNYCRILATVPDLEQRHVEIYRKILKIIKEDRWGILRNPYTRIKNKIAAIASFGGSQCIQKLYQFKLRG